MGAGFGRYLFVACLCHADRGLTRSLDVGQDRTDRYTDRHMDRQTDFSREILVKIISDKESF